MRRSRAGEVFAGISPARSGFMTCSGSVEISFHFIDVCSWGVREMNEKKNDGPNLHIYRGATVVKCSRAEGEFGGPGYLTSQKPAHQLPPWIEFEVRRGGDGLVVTRLPFR